METTFKGVKITTDTNEQLNSCLYILSKLYNSDYERFEVITSVFINDAGKIAYTTCLLEDENQTLTF